MSFACPRIGAVSYLNTKPLVAGLGQHSGKYELLFDLPSRLADRLASGELDVALIPVIAAVADPSYTIVSDACIACRGPVWSVKLMSRVPLNQIRTLALDEGSRTSQILTRILLAKQYGTRPSCSLLRIDQDWHQTSADAALIIGDRAMKADSDQFPYWLDLGEAWFEWTKQPFVFAAWTARPGADLNRLDSLLTESRDFGLRQIRQIATQHADDYGLSINECHRYLDHYLHYHLGTEAKRGLHHYIQQAAELSLIPDFRELNFHDCPTDPRPA